MHVVPSEIIMYLIQNKKSNTHKTSKNMFKVILLSKAYSAVT